MSNEFPTSATESAEQADPTDKLAADITDLLLPSAPPRWRRLRLAFSVTVAAISAEAVFTIDDDTAVTVEVPSAAAELLQVLRMVTLRAEQWPWWHVVFERDQTGTTHYEFGYGDQPFPPDRVLPAAAYRADLAQFPRDRLPVWLAAHLAVDDGSQRLPHLLTRARTDRHTTGRPVRFLDPGTALARWATVASAAVAIGTPWGPRILGSTAIFEATNGSGSTLQLLPGGRAVLSGGIWNAPELDAAYNTGLPVPDYYAGVPDWLDAPVLNHRALTGQLSFCYWWDGANWACGQSPSPTTIGAAIPGLWTPTTVIDIVCGVLGESVSRSAVTDLVTAADAGAVTHELAVAAFDISGDVDLAGAWTQLALAGLTR